MSLLFATGYVIVGFAMLIFGGDFLVKSAVNFATRLGIPAAIVGATVIAGGTSAPELVTSVVAAIRGNSDIAIGNVVGSNIFNILPIIGIAALIRPNLIDPQTAKFDYPVMIASCLLLLVLGWDAQFGFIEGLVFCGVLIAYIGILIYKQKLSETAVEIAATESLPAVWFDGWILFLGFVALIGGAHLAVEGGVAIGQYFGLSERVIGLTIISAGTSLPELATSAIASYRGRSDIAVSNVIGSNLINILGVVGISALFTKMNFSVALIQNDAVLMTAFCLLLLPIMLSKQKVIQRWFGGSLIAIYLGYLVYIL